MTEAETPHPQAQETTRAALARLWPAIEKAMGGLVFTADRAGEVAADMATIRAALSATPAEPVGASAQQAEPRWWLALLDEEQRPQLLQTDRHEVAFRDKRHAESWIATKLGFDGWRYTLIPLYVHPAQQAEQASDAQDAALSTPLPKEPPTGLLVSMAIRYDHALGIPGYYDHPLLEPVARISHAERLASTMRTMRQLYEEVSGHGFYRPEKEAEYAAITKDQA